MPKRHRSNTEVLSDAILFSHDTLAGAIASREFTAQPTDHPEPILIIDDRKEKKKKRFWKQLHFLLGVYDSIRGFSQFRQAVEQTFPSESVWKHPSSKGAVHDHIQKLLSTKTVIMPEECLVYLLKINNEDLLEQYVDPHTDFWIQYKDLISQLLLEAEDMRSTIPIQHLICSHFLFDKILEEIRFRQTLTTFLNPENP